MGLPSLPPPLFDRHQLHHPIRRENVLHPPYFLPGLYSHTIHPPPLLQHGQSHILLPLPPQPPPSPTPRPPFQMAHPLLPFRSNLSSHTSHRYENVLPPKPYPHRRFLPHLPPPPKTHDKTLLQRVHDYPARNPTLVDENFRSVPDSGNHQRYAGNFCRNRELYNYGVDLDRKRINGVEDQAHDLYDGRRFDSFRKVDYNVTRQDSINGWIHGLYKDRDHDERRACNGVTNRGCELDREVTLVSDDERRWNRGRNDKSPLRIHSKRPKKISSLSRSNCRLKSEVNEGNFVGYKKKRRGHTKAAIPIVQSAKYCSSDGNCEDMLIQKELDENVSGGEEKEEVKYLQSGMDSNRKREDSLELDISFKSNMLVAKAVMVTPCMDVEANINSSLVIAESTSNTSASSIVKSSEDVVKDVQLECVHGFQSNSLGTSDELLDRAALAKSGNVADDANDVGGIAGENETQKVMPSEGPTRVGSAEIHQRKSIKKRKARKLCSLEANMHMKRDKHHIIRIRPSASIHPSLNTALSEGGDSGPKLKKKRSSLATFSASLHVADCVIPKSSGHAEKMVTSTENVDAVSFTHETFLANESACPVGNGGPSQHGNNMDSVISAYDAQKIKLECINQFDSFRLDRVDEICEHSLLENSFAHGPYSVMGSHDGNDVTDTAQQNQCSSKILASDISIISDSTVPIGPENCNISDVDHADDRAKEVPLDEVNMPKVAVDSEEDRSLEGATISHYSDFNSIRTDFLAAEHEGIIVDVCSLNDSSKKPSIEGSLETLENAKTCLPVVFSPNVTTKRNASGTEVVSDMPTTTSDEVERVLAQVLPSAMETEFHGERGRSEQIDKSIGGLYRVEHQTPELDFVPKGKKRKVSSPISGLSSFSQDEIVADGIKGDCSKLYQCSTGLAESAAVKSEDSYFSNNTEPLACRSENEITCGPENMSGRKPEAPYPNVFLAGNSLEKVASNKSQNNANLSHSLPKFSNGVVRKLNHEHGEQALSKNQLIFASPKAFLGHRPSYVSNSRKLQPTEVAKSWTWHRNDNSSVAIAETKLPSPSPPCLETKTNQNFRSSYMRKGNSLVRNPSPPAVTSVRNPSPPAVTSVRNPSPPAVTSVRNPSPPAVTSARNPPPPAVTSVLYHSSSVYRLKPYVDESKDNRLAPCADDLKDNQTTDSKTGEAEAHSTMRMDPVNIPELPSRTQNALEERMKSPGVLGRADPGSNLNDQSKLDGVNMQKNIRYIKRRSNQLIVASGSSNMSILGADKKCLASTDGYYKRKKNQLVRTSSADQVKKENANGNSHRLVPRAILPKMFTRQQPDIIKHSKLSFVWKLHDTEWHKTSMGSKKILSRLFSWKRTTNWRNFVHALSIRPNMRSSSTSRQTLMFSRKRGAIYTRSTHGYSLRMSKVLSVAGSSLKWSKSIEKNSKKANEEATRAVAAAGKRKKEEIGAVSKSRNNVSRKLVLSVQLRPGERIFRIGSERYKMDPSRRTLQRITAEKEESPPVALQTEKNLKRSYVPRRLLIGNEEYVRIGNGNQLVRDPKKRTRALASEKVRWSLRTARLRMARKKKFCQFFTRFGKCNKDDGKCPYIHDPSIIAVCTKFLNGLCTKHDCKLTHKVIPERMEDCSYFLKGLCSNDNCPYRHVNVAPDSTVCKSFLRGYCADGNKCLKKHTYVCPTYEATGSCLNLPSCKLHHPKKKAEKQQPTSDQKTIKGRYFDGGLVGDAELASDIPTGRTRAKGKEDVVVGGGGKYVDYISLDVGEDDEMDQGSDTDDDDEPDFDVLV